MGRTFSSVPYIYLKRGVYYFVRRIPSDLQTFYRTDRVRIIPVPYRLGFLKELMLEIDHGQETVLPETILATDVTNRNTQLRRIVAKIGDYQPYCTRHTFKHHLSLTHGAPMQIQYLQGWSGVKQDERQRFEQYGQAAYENRAKHPEIF